MKKVKQIEHFVQDGSTSLCLLFEAENDYVKKEYLRIDCCGDEEIFSLAILTEPEHQVDYKLDGDGRLCWFRNISLGLEADISSDEEEATDGDTDYFYAIPPKVLVVKKYLDDKNTALCILVETNEGEKDYVVVDTYSDDDVFPVAAFTQPGHQINCRFDDYGNIIWFKNFTLNIENEIAPESEGNSDKISQSSRSQSELRAKKTDWFGLTMIILAIGLIIAAGIIFFSK